MTCIVLFVGNKTINQTYNKEAARKKGKYILFGALLGWHVYLYVLTKTEAMYTLDFPPRFALFTIIPLFIFSGVFVYKNQKFGWIQNLPSRGLFLFQTMRIFIETLFYFSVAKGILHVNATIEGYNFDMIYAYSILFIGIITYSNFNKYRHLILWWNHLGLLVIASIIVVFQTTIYLPEIYGDIEPFPIDFLQYPYVLVASFLMPLAVFVHLLSIAQLKHSNS
ncbi:MAG: hypothetical protein CL840_11890 [Crocinitomicaceae bacterium]|nr:hypothetical protein [Crocinitomicaceae bacterium]